MIGADPEFFLRNFFSRAGAGPLAAEAIAECVHPFRDRRWLARSARRRPAAL